MLQMMEAIIGKEPSRLVIMTSVVFDQKSRAVMQDRNVRH